MNVTAVLLSYRRGYHIPTIIRHLRTFPQVTEVIVWANEQEPSEEMAALADRCIHSPRNQFVLGRFWAAMEAKNETVVVQDDDLLVGNIPELLETYSREHKIVANLAQDRSSRHWEYWQEHRPPWVEMGFGAVFPRDWAKKLDEWPYDHGLLARKADKIFSVVHPWTAIKAGPESITRLFYNGVESGRDEHALSLRPDHRGLTETAVALAQDWMRSKE